MAQQKISASPCRSGWLAVTVVISGRPRTFAPGPWLGAALAIGLPALAAWYLGATLYLVFHDQLLASLIARQTDTQYAYEDRIAGLSTQLDRETSRSLVDRHTLETTVSMLEERSTRLAARATLLDRLVARNAPVQGALAAPVAKVRPTITMSRNPLLGTDITGLPDGVRAYSPAEPARATPMPAPDTPALRLRGETNDTSGLPLQSPNAGKRASLDEAPMAARTETVATTLTTIEQSQAHAIAALREPTLKTIAKLRTALMEVGLPAGVIPASARTTDAGGPFVPLPEGALTFEQDAALLQDAVFQADRLTALADTVPLRKPLSGPLEVTSTFGPRIDPFLGRPAMHTGIDFREPSGESVHATAGGTVTIAASEGGYGTMVEVDHGNGLSTRYAHLSSTSVVPGQKIETGAIVGRVGSSGRATGPHLHYETRINGEAVDPTRFLKAGARLFAED
ncbi:M23 family metallopeptidase [Beijerinckia sp. L45]|uniref:M23 family metallopeptidase n=1 Tax=Beijerinckia sp. L45 TaxID=1641855 RepID=UPI00131E3F2C|nr:M23 family metallopeptidase [Beijerinckia sp. L45]